MTRDLVFEIGCEELPSAPLNGAIAQLRTLAEKALADARLAHEGVGTFGSPRRLVLQVSALAERQDDLSEKVRGPAARAAFDADGNPTKAAEGFARSRGVTVDELVREPSDGGEYVFAVVDSVGQRAQDVLPGLLCKLAEDLEWPKSQRWGDGETRFLRPVRWLLALWGDEVVAVEYAGLTAGRATYGHRFLAENPIEVAEAGAYADATHRGLVVFDQNERAERVREGVAQAAVAAGGSAVVPDKTFAEVVNLVEWPTVAVGRFDQDFLGVPREVLETAMESHQRYFPVEDADGKLLPSFIVAHNGDPARTETIVAGHERVIRARLADAKFFYEEDLKRPLEAYVESLTTIVFQERLGTVGERVERIERLAGELAKLHGASADETADATRAARLAKADLVTHVVVEFPSLQGVMGMHYANAAGERAGVAQAVVDHYRPRFSGDELPSGVAGMLVSAADKLDTIVGIIGVGLAPTGSADPYGVRRAALGVLAMMMDGGLRIAPLHEALLLAAEGHAEQREFDAAHAVKASRAFLTDRLEGVLQSRGYAYDTVDAVFAYWTGAADDPADAEKRAAALQAVRASGAIGDLATAYTRAKNLSEEALGTDAETSLMGDEELRLAEALALVEAEAEAATARHDYPRALELLASLRGPIDAFFDGVLVMDPDDRLRENRLRLLNRFVAPFSRFADLSKLAE